MVERDPKGGPEKPAADVSSEAGVGIEDFRGDSATDDIARKAVIKSIVDTEQIGGECLPVCSPTSVHSTLQGPVTGRHAACR